MPTIDFHLSAHNLLEIFSFAVSIIVWKTLHLIPVCPGFWRSECCSVFSVIYWVSLVVKELNSAEFMVRTTEFRIPWQNNPDFRTPTRTCTLKINFQNVTHWSLKYIDPEMSSSKHQQCSLLHTLSKICQKSGYRWQTHANNV